jgi:hypothetical protein
MATAVGTRVTNDTVACIACGSPIGVLNAAGLHSLCAARLRRGQPTPSLGRPCRECQGTGCYVNGAYSSCPRCEGSMIEPGTEG